jgi:hypothetical protein
VSTSAAVEIAAMAASGLNFFICKVLEGSGWLG